MPTTRLESPAVMATHLGQEVAVRDWLDVGPGRVLRVADATDGSTQVNRRVTIERQGGDEPAVVADWVARLHA